MEQVQFSMGFNGFDLAIGNVFKLYDEDYTAQAGAGRIISATATTVTFDRPVVISGSASVDVLLPDGITLENHPMTTTAGTYSTVSITGTWSVIPNAHADFIVTSAVAPRLFRVTGLAQDDTNPHQVKVDALFYDPNKYAAIESGISVPAAVYSAITGSVIGDPTGIAFQPIGASNADGVRLGLLVTWQKPALGIPTQYVLKWRRNSGNYVTVAGLSVQEFEIMQAAPGTYDVVIQSVNINNLTSTGASASYTLSTTGGSASTLDNVSTLQCIGGGTTFTTADLSVQWTNPSSNNNLGTKILKDFQVNVYLASGGLLRTEYVGAGTQPGATCNYIYTFAKNVSDGGPNRTIKIVVCARDMMNNVTTGTTVTFTNPAPSVPGSITVTGLQSGTLAAWAVTSGLAVQGYMVWASQTSGFTPNAGNMVYKGFANVFSHDNLTKGSVWYYRVAAYDSFGDDPAGASLNISGQYTATASTSVGIPSGASLPGSATEGDLFFDTTDGKLYRWHSGAWTVATDGADIIANSITGGKIVAATITSGNIAANTITGSNIAAGTIAASNIAASTITSGQIAANTITAAQMATGTITAASGIIANATIGTLQLAGNSVTVPVYASWTGPTALQYLGPTSFVPIAQTVPLSASVSTGLTIMVVAQVWATTSGNDDWQVNIYRNGSLIGSNVSYAQYVVKFSFAFTFLDTAPGVNPYYQVQLVSLTGSGSDTNHGITIQYVNALFLGTQR